MTADPRFRVPLVMLAALLLHTVVAGPLQLAGARPEIMLLVPITAALAGGPERGAALGFVAGLLSDIFLNSPFGLTSLVYTLVGHGVGVLRDSMLAFSGPLRLMAVAAASAIGVVLWACVAWALGRPVVVDRLLWVVVVVAGVNTLLAPAGSRAMAWALANSSNPQ
ncbi:MAG: rod shape-determining protein MreD [Acidimicrobiales bacterium]